MGQNPLPDLLAYKESDWSKSIQANITDINTLPQTRAMLLMLRSKVQNQQNKQMHQWPRILNAY